MTEFYSDLSFIFNKVLNNPNSLISWKMVSNQKRKPLKILLDDEQTIIQLGFYCITMKYKKIELNSIEAENLAEFFRGYQLLPKTEIETVFALKDYDYVYGNFDCKILALFTKFVNKQNIYLTSSRENNYILRKGVKCL